MCSIIRTAAMERAFSAYFFEMAMTKAFAFARGAQAESKTGARFDIRRRSGNEPKDAQLSDDESELRRLLPFVFRGDAEACAKANAVVRRLLTNV